MTPHAFITKWRASALKERSASQEHFIDLCHLLDEPTPAEADPSGETYCFERGARKDTGGDGWADVWKRHHFAWEYKGQRADLDAAFGQLRQYSLALENPPLLIVSDMVRFRIRTNWTNSVSRTHEFWTGAMIVQVALTAIGIPVALESAIEALRTLEIRAEFPGPEYLAARIDVDRPFEEEATPAFEARRARTFEELQRRIAEEPGVVAVTFADRAPGSAPTTRFGEVESSPGAGPAYDDVFWTSEVGPGFFEALDRRIVAGRGFHGGDRSPRALTVIVNEAFARTFSLRSRGGSPVGARLRYPASSARPDAPAAKSWFEIVGVVRDVGLDPDDWGNERPYVFHAAAAGTVSPLVTTVRVRGDPAALSARLPVIAADVDAGLFVRDARPLNAWIRQRDVSLAMQVGGLAGVTSLVLFVEPCGDIGLRSGLVQVRQQ